MIVPRKKAADPSAPRSPNVLTLASTEGWHLDDGGNNAALRVSAVYRCITYISDTISLMPFYVMDRKTRERKPDHPLVPVLTQRTNEIMPPTEYKRLMEVNRLLRGNAYAYIGRDAKSGQVVELLPLSPDLVSPQLDEDRHLHYLYADPLSGRVFDLMPSQVLHYKAFLAGELEGISPLRYARDVIAKDRSAKAYERSIYNNGGRPSGVLYTEADLGGVSAVKGPDGEFLSKKEVVRQAWERVHGGGANAFRTAVLDLGLKYQPISMNNTDAQFVESNEITIADIARYFGVPLHVLQSGKQSYESNVQNRVEFVQTTALPVITACEEEDSYKLLSSNDLAFHLRVRRNMDAALRGDTANRAAFYEVLWRIGALSANDILAMEDRPAIAGGDTHMASLNYVPLEDFLRLSQLRNGG